MDEKNWILLVEDEDAIRLTLKDFLVRKGFDVLVASEGVGAIKQILDHDVKVIISDYRMDILGGDYWIKFLQRFCSDKHVVVTSGFLRPEFDIPYDVVYKPFEFTALADRITELLEA